MYQLDLTESRIAATFCLSQHQLPYEVVNKTLRKPQDEQGIALLLRVEDHVVEQQADGMLRMSYAEESKYIEGKARAAQEKEQEQLEMARDDYLKDVNDKASASACQLVLTNDRLQLTLPGYQ